MTAIQIFVIHRAGGSHIYHLFGRLIFPVFFPAGSGPGMNLYSIVVPFCWQRYHSSHWLIRIDIRKRNFFCSANCISIHSCFFCILTQLTKMFCLQFIHIHKGNHSYHCQEKQRQYQRSLYCKAGLLALPVHCFKKGAQRRFPEKVLCQSRGCFCTVASQRTIPSCFSPFQALYVFFQHYFIQYSSSFPKKRLSAPFYFLKYNGMLLSP